MGSRFAACLAALSLLVAWPALAQVKFDRPIRMEVGFAAGGTADIIARVVADKMPPIVGQPVVVENRPGAIGRIAADTVRNSPPDGTTLLVMPIGPMVVAPHVYKDLGFDPLKDFVPVALGATFQLAVGVSPATNAKTWSDFVAWAKANPTKVSVANSGAGSLPHFLAVLLARESGINMVHVPYKGSSAYVTDLMSGQIPAAVDAIADLSELHRAGKIRIVASTGAVRSTALPDVPTFKELGVNVEAMGWFGFFAPAKTPKPIIDALNAAINKALQSPDVAEKLSKLGMDPATGTPDDFARVVNDDYNQWGPVVRASNFKPDQ